MHYSLVMMKICAPLCKNRQDKATYNDVTAAQEIYQENPMMFQPLHDTLPINRPQSVNEVVEIIIHDLSLRDKVTLASLSEDNLETSVYLALAKTIRKEFGLYSGNKKLLESCSSYLGHEYDRFEDPAMVIVKELWKKIKQGHQLRIVK